MARESHKILFFFSNMITNRIITCMYPLPSSLQISQRCRRHLETTPRCIANAPESHHNQVFLIS